MNSDIVQQTIDHTLAGTIIFPEVVKALIGEGVVTYHVDLVRNENRYYTAGGETMQKMVALDHGCAAMNFSATGVEGAVRAVQAGKMKYREFVKTILEAGCDYYIAYLAGKRVIYFGRNGDMHIEHFPKTP